MQFPNFWQESIDETILNQLCTVSAVLAVSLSQFMVLILTLLIESAMFESCYLISHWVTIKLKRPTDHQNSELG